MRNLFHHASAIEPVLPKLDKELEELVVRFIRQAGNLNAALHPVTRSSIVAILRNMNSYYSNLIEGHHTKPVDIERALRSDFGPDPQLRILQLESKAHVEVEQLLDAHLKRSGQIAATATLCWIHRMFYERMPLEFLRLENSERPPHIVRPGELRQGFVEVGRHLAPHWESVPAFMQRFEQAYDPERLDPVSRVVAAAAAHHRLLWIHPFDDGNGRVARLWSQAYLQLIGHGGGGLWTISRGLARRQRDYFDALAGADAPRRNDLDGRGNLSEQALREFCKFFLETSLDQIDFMSALLDLDALMTRVQKFGSWWGLEHKLGEEVGWLLRDCLLRGQLKTSEAAQALGKPERTVRRILEKLIKEELLWTDGPGKPVRLGWPVKHLSYYLPNLFPAGL